MLQNLSNLDIKNNFKVSNSFLNVDFQNLDLNCNIYKGNFYLDSFNFFLIDDNFNTFNHLFTRDPYQQNKHFFTDTFFKNFQKNQHNFKKLDKVFILGSNAANNYYSNLLQFLPRIFFFKNTNLKIAIHRNSSTKFRNFIKRILTINKIDFKFMYLDDGFYKFTNSEMPEFFNVPYAVKILRKILLSNKSESRDKKIYVTRESSSYRKIINDADIIPILREKGYKVINPHLYDIEEQIRIFSNADKIVAAHGSNLSNIIFCKPKTQICEIGPSFNKDFEKPFENRYKYLANLNNLQYSRLISDTVPVKDHSEVAKKYINKNILNNSCYYNNLIVKLKDIKSID